MKKLLNYSFTIFQAAVISFVVLSSVYNVSCKASTEGIELLSGDYESPKISAVEIKSDSQISVEFSEEISVKGLTLCKEDSSSSTNLSTSLDVLKNNPVSVGFSTEISEDQKSILCNLSTPTEIGQKYILFGEIEDVHGNSLTFSAPITGFNSNVARVVISEIQGEKSSKIPGPEFVELYVLEPGNLAGLVISSAIDGEENDVMLPSVEVDAKEVVVVHLRTTGEGCVSELGTDLSLSTALGSSSARDIWVESELTGRLGSSYDVISLTDTNSGELKDAFLYAKETYEKWNKTAVAAAAKNAFESGIWSEDGIENAFRFKTTGVYARTDLEELEAMAESGTLPEKITSSKENWDRVTSANVTPGTI